MEKIKDLPVFELVLNSEDQGLSFVSLVTNPAIERNFFAFSDDVRFSQDSTRMILTGALLIPDKLIFRHDDEIGDYYVKLSKETIFDLNLQWMKEGMTDQINKHHRDIVKDAFMFETWIADKGRGIHHPKGFEDLPDGTWYGSVKITDPKIWNEEVMTGNWRGFSIEGKLDQVLVEMQKQEISEELEIIRMIEKIL